MNFELITLINFLLLLQFSGSDFDLMSRRVLCASSMELAQETAKILVQYYPERD